jgi:hypothetical protein
MHMLLLYVTIFIIGSNLCVVSCNVLFIRLYSFCFGVCDVMVVASYHKPLSLQSMTYHITILS